jgi:hypothetical protein
MNWDVLGFPSFFAVMRILYTYTESKNKICILFFIGQYLTPHLIFWNIVPLKSPGIVWKWKYLSAYPSFFVSILREYSSVYAEYGKIRVIWDTKNCLRIREKNLCVHGEEAKIMVQHETF